MENSIHYTKEGISYYFCSSQCLNEFLEPEKALKKLKMHVIISIALTIPIVLLSLPHMILQLGHLYPIEMMGYINYVLLALATPIQFWIGWRFYHRILGWYQSKSIKYGYIDCYWNNSCICIQRHSYHHSWILSIYGGIFRNSCNHNYSYLNRKTS